MGGPSVACPWTSRKASKHRIACTQCVLPFRSAFLRCFSLVVSDSCPLRYSPAPRCAAVPEHRHKGSAAAVNRLSSRIRPRLRETAAASGPRVASDVGRRGGGGPLTRGSHLAPGQKTGRLDRQPIQPPGSWSGIRQCPVSAIPKLNPMCRGLRSARMPANTAGHQFPARRSLPAVRFVLLATPTTNT